jgi:protocatechuate 3,4-dioxygenase beta subunit
LKRLLFFALLGVVCAALWWFRSPPQPLANSLDAPSGPREIDFVPVLDAATSTPPIESGVVAPRTATSRASVRGRCVDARGRPLAGVEIACSFPPATTLTGEDGRFTLELQGLTSARQRTSVRASAKGLGARSLDVELDATAVTTLVDWVLTPAAILSGVVRDGDGQPLPGVEVRCTAAEFACTGSCYTPRGFALSSTVTDAAGAFTIDDAPAGAVCVWAGEHGQTLWVSTPAFDARPGERVEGLELVAPRVVRESLLGVRVIDPQGRPVSGAQIHYRFHDRKSGGAGRGDANENGHWVLDIAQRTPHHVVAVDPSGRFRPTMLREVKPGVLDAPLTMTPARELVLRVVDERGEPALRYSLRLGEATSDELAPGVPVDEIVLIDEDERERERGRTTLRAPSFPFVLSVRARGAIELDAGPFDPDTLGKELVLTLARPPGVRGQVTFDGAPAARAHVSLHAANDEPAAASPRYGEALVSTEADERGAFSLPCEQSGSYWLRATRSDAALTELGPLEIDVRKGLDGVSMKLTVGGALDGLAHPSHGEPPAGIEVVAQRGGHAERRTVTDATGAFRFEHLTPGPWIVERAGRPAANTTSEGAPERHVAVLCNVVDGASTHVELPAPDADLAVLRGVFRLGGEAAPGWTASVDNRRASCDAEGRFELTALLPGARRIVLEAPDADGVRLRLEGEVWLRSGANDWSFDPPMGRIQGRLQSRKRSAAESRTLEWTWRGDGGWTAQGVLALSSDGGFALTPMPAGRVRFDGSDEWIQIDATATVDVEL